MIYEECLQDVFKNVPEQEFHFITIKQIFKTFHSRLVSGPQNG